MQLLSGLFDHADSDVCVCVCALQRCVSWRRCCSWTLSRGWVPRRRWSCRSSASSGTRTRRQRRCRTTRPSTTWTCSWTSGNVRRARNKTETVWKLNFLKKGHRRSLLWWDFTWWMKLIILFSPVFAQVTRSQRSWPSGRPKTPGRRHFNSLEEQRHHHHHHSWPRSLAPSGHVCICTEVIIIPVALASTELSSRRSGVSDYGRVFLHPFLKKEVQILMFCNLSIVQQCSFYMHFIFVITNGLFSFCLIPKGEATP